MDPLALGIVLGLMFLLPNPKGQIYPVYDGHPNKNGYKIIARSVQQSLRYTQQSPDLYHSEVSQWQLQQNLVVQM